MGVVQFGWDGIRMRLCQIIIVAFVAPGDLGSSWCRKARTRHLVLVHLVGFDNSPSLLPSCQRRSPSQCRVGNIMVYAIPGCAASVRRVYWREANLRLKLPPAELSRTRDLRRHQVVGQGTYRLGFSVENSTPYRIPSSHDLSSR